ncbi:MAG: HU family DNA-binding protein [Erysipelotrichaceae bacterium]|nr:HU family DNA-binding protein [Erysipelotrichaceae bacterium]
MEKITKKDLAEVLVEKFDLTKKESNEIITVLFDEITAQLVKGNVTDITGFGKFVVKERKAREGINPLNPEEKIHISASRVPGFKAAKALKTAVDPK